MPHPSEFGYFEIDLRGDEDPYPSLIDISTFLYDFNLLYEFSRIVVDPTYARYRFSTYSNYRNARRLWSGDRLEIVRLHLGSPIELVTIAAAMPVAAGALWVLVQTFEKIANFSINREILKLQRDKLKKELDSLPNDVPRQMLEDETTFREQLRSREADRYFDRVARRLRESVVRVREIEITHIRELPQKRDTDARAKS